MIKPDIYSASLLFLLISFGIGLFPQSSADPLMMLPFVMMTGFLVSSGALLKLCRKDIILFLLLSLWGWWGASAIFSGVPFPSKVTWVILGTLPASYMLAQLSSRPLLSLLPILAIPFALSTIWQGLSGVHRPDAPFDDANLLGAFYACCTVSGLSFLSQDHDKRIRIAGIMMITAIVVALCFTQSRSAFITLICGSTLFFSFPQTRRSLQVKVPALLAFIGPALFFFATFFLNRFHIDENISGRLSIWTAAWGMGWEHPFLGFGLGTFHLYYPPYRLAGDNSLGWMVHMDPLQFSIESGWPAAIILYALFVVPFLFALRNRGNLTPHHITAVAALACIFVGMHMNYPLHSPPFLMILGVALSGVYPKPIQGPTLSSPMASPVLLAQLASLWIAAQSTLTFLLANEVQKSFHLHDQARFDRAITACIQDGDKDFPDCKIMAARFLNLAPNSDWGQIESLLHDVQRANPTDPEPFYILGQHDLTTTPPAWDSALSYARKSLHLNPAYWPARRMAIEVFVKKEDKTSAKMMLEDALIYPYAQPVRDDISRLRKRLDE